MISASPHMGDVMEKTMNTNIVKLKKIRWLYLAVGVVLLLFLGLILRLIHLAERQPFKFGRVYGYCVLSIFLFHVFINVGMVLGLTPVIGIPLPFFSYGGSSLWGFTILLFIFLRIDAGRNLIRT